jgi:hypothetical protein
MFAGGRCGERIKPTGSNIAALITVLPNKMSNAVRLYNRLALIAETMRSIGAMVLATAFTVEAAETAKDMS